MTFTLTAAQLRDALDFINPDGEDNADEMATEVTFFFRKKAGVSDEGEPLPRGWYCYLSEYPEEGCYGPLNG